MNKKSKNGNFDKWLNGFESFEKGKINYLLKKWQIALNYFNHAIECGRGYEDNIYELRAECLKETGSPLKALKDYNKAISLNPNDCNLYFMRSFLKVDADIDGAIADLEQAIALSQIDNELNSTYRLGAKDMGWPDGHTDLYKNHLRVVHAGKKSHIYKNISHNENTPHAKNVKTKKEDQKKENKRSIIKILKNIFN